MNSKHAFLALSVFTLVSIAHGEREVFAPTKLAPVAEAGIIRFGDGTAAAPSISFSDDINTGIFSDSGDSNVLAMSTNGTERMRISSTGLVGIGTTPNVLLDVLNPSTAASSETARFRSDTAATPYVSFFNGASRTGIIQYSASNLFLTADANKNVQITTTGAGVLTQSTGGSERFRIDSSGNVGIGTTTNLSTLTINGPIAPKGSTDVNAATYTVATTDSSLRFTTTNCTVTLPAAASFPGRILWLNTVTANSVTSNASNVIPLGSNTAGTAIFAATAGKFAMIQSNGTNWVTMMSN